MDGLPLFDSEAVGDTGRKECHRCKLVKSPCMFLNDTILDGWYIYFRRRPEKVCLCPWLPETPKKLQNVRFLVLQHPNEIYRPMRTMTILESSVTNESCITFKGRRFSHAKYENLHRIISTEKTVVLYPSKDATPFNDVHPTKGVSFCNFILIDGTWQQAKEMYGQNEFLQKLDKVGHRHHVEK